MTEPPRQALPEVQRQAQDKVVKDPVKLDEAKSNSQPRWNHELLLEAGLAIVVVGRKRILPARVRDFGALLILVSRQTRYIT